MDFKDYYKILGVEPSATEKQIKSAYRKQARKYHPDVSDHPEAEEKFKEVAEAYEVLKSADKRAEYDEIRQYGAGDQPFRPPPGWQPRGSSEDPINNDDYSEFFSSVFGHSFDSSEYANRGRSQRGRDIETNLPIFLEDTLERESKTVSYHLGGVNKTLKVKIPAGVSDGEHIRLKGQGSAGTGDAPAGDLYLRIRLVPHPMFDVEGHNLIITLPLAPWEAALGTKVALPTLHGKVNLTVPPNTQSGQRMRMKGKGLITKQGSKGDLYALIKIVIPCDQDESLNKHWEQLAQESEFDPRAEWSNTNE